VVFSLLGFQVTQLIATVATDAGQLILVAIYHALHYTFPSFPAGIVFLDFFDFVYIAAFVFRVPPGPIISP